MCRQGSRRSDEEALEEQVRKMGEELKEVRELYEAEQDKTRVSEEEMLQLHNQVLMTKHWAARREAPLINARSHPVCLA